MSNKRQGCNLRNSEIACNVEFHYHLKTIRVHSASNLARIDRL